MVASLLACVSVLSLHTVSVPLSSNPVERPASASRQADWMQRASSRVEAELVARWQNRR